MTTLANYLDSWLAVHAAQIRAQTRTGYRGVIDRYITPRAGHLPLADVDAPTLTRLYAQLATGGSAGGGPLSRRTVAYVHDVLRKALRDAVADGLLAANPAANARVPRVDHRAAPAEQRPMAWTVDELRRFLAASEGHEHWPIWWVAAATGLRRAELCGLSHDDLDLPRLLVRRTWNVVGGEAGFGPTKTGKSRSLTLDQATAAFLAGLTRVHDAVFVSRHGGRFDPMWLTKEFARVVARVDVPRITFHGLRHTHATLLLQAGVPVHVVARRLGHAKVSMTLETYAHVLPTQDGQAADAFADALGAA